MIQILALFIAAILAIFVIDFIRRGLLKENTPYSGSRWFLS